MLKATLIAVLIVATLAIVPSARAATPMDWLMGLFGWSDFQGCGDGTGICDAQPRFQH